MTAKLKSAYSEEFYNEQAGGSFASAKIIVPLVLDLIPARSVCDVGCGVGMWLRAFVEQGVTDIHGFDGLWVQETSLRIPAGQFTAVDLSAPVTFSRRFDLACSLEVAEHLPESVAEQFVDNLTALAPVVLFSAAIPRQGGTEHVNERWPDFWAHLFKERGFFPVDYLRPKIWEDRKVEWWYRQNALIFASAEAMARNRRLRDAYEASHHFPLNLVHPDAYLENLPAPECFSGAMKKLPRLFMRAINKKLD